MHMMYFAVNPLSGVGLSDVMTSENGWCKIKWYAVSEIVSHFIHIKMQTSLKLKLGKPR